jgi:outer membrane protein assembly factor BamB
MKQTVHQKTYSKCILYVTICTTFLSILFCGGLGRIRVPEKESLQSSQNWTTPFRSNLRHNASDHDVDPPMMILWKKGYKSNVTDQPLGYAGYIISTLQNGNLVYLDIDKQELIGEGKIAPGISRAPTIDNNILYYGANLGDETLVAFDLIKKKKIWKARLPHQYTSPIIWKDRVYSGTKGGQLFCLNKINGQTIWHFNAKSSLFGVPAEADGNIIFCDVKANIYSVDAVSGYHNWVTELQSNIHGGPLVANNLIYVGTTAGIFYALESDSGNIVWQVETGGSIYGNAAYKEGILYVGNNAHKLIAIDAGSGKILWEYETRGIINSAPLVGENYIYFGSWDRFLYVLSRHTGEEMSKIEFKRPIKSSPLLYRDRIYIHLANDGFYCLGNVVNQSG